MINSRKLEDLVPAVSSKAAAFLDACRAVDIDVLITSTFRDYDSQRELYAQGRTKPGKIVTNANAGYSMHNFRCAFDVVPLRFGKPVWGTKGNGIDEDPTDDDKDDLELWQRIGAIGESVGLEWGGNWTNFPDMPHFQFTSGLTMAQLRGGAKVV